MEDILVTVRLVAFLLTYYVIKNMLLTCSLYYMYVILVINFFILMTVILPSVNKIHLLTLVIFYFIMS